MEPLGAPALTIYSLFLTIKKTTYKFQKIPRARFSLGSQPYEKVFDISWTDCLTSKPSSAPHPFWYRFNGMGAQKNAPKISCNLFSIYISRKN